MKEKKCPACEGGNLVKVDDILSNIGGYIFVEKGERCAKCGEEFIDEHDSQKTIMIARHLGVWPEPLKLQRHLSRSGNSLVLRIPADVERQLKLRPGERVEISRVGNKIVIETE